MHTGANGSPTSACATREAAVLKQEGFCRLCDLSGQVTIYRKKYTGQSTITIIDHNGEERQLRTVITAHCSCEVGKWMRSCCDAEALLRIPPLAQVGIGKLKNWTPLDPTLPDWVDDDQVDWKAARARFASMGRRVVEKVYPKSDGNRVSAYREMAEPLPRNRPMVEESPVPF